MDCTFKPQLVSKQNDILARKASKSKQTTYERLFERAAIIKEKAKHTVDKFEAQREKEAECTF